VKKTKDKKIGMGIDWSINMGVPLTCSAFDPDNAKLEGEDNINGRQIIFWDWKEQPDFEEIISALEKYKSPTIKQVDTGADEFAIVIGERPITEKEAQKSYDDWQKREENI